VLSAVDVQNAQCGVQRVQDAGRVYRLDNHHWTRVGGVVRWAVVFNLDCEGDYMNRRGFFGLLTAAVGWVVGVKAVETKEPQDAMTFDLSGGIGSALTAYEWKADNGMSGTFATTFVLYIGQEIGVHIGQRQTKATITHCRVM
jgi:hypothetical protein